MTIMNILIKVAEVVGVSLVYCLILFITNFINAKTNAEKTAKISDIIKTAVQTSVSYVNQTLVEKLKKENLFSIEKQHEALEKALETCAMLIDKETDEYIKVNYGDSAVYLKTLIEAEVKKQKAITNN